MADRIQLLRLRADAQPVRGTQLRASLGEPFVTITVLATIVIFSDDPCVIQNKPDLAGEPEEVLLGKQASEIVHDDGRHDDAGRPAPVAQVKAVYSGAEPNPVFVMSISA